MAVPPRGTAENHQQGEWGFSEVRPVTKPVTTSDAPVTVFDSL